MARQSVHKQVSMRLSLVGGKLLEDVARLQGISKTAVVEIAIRDIAQAKGIPIPTAAAPMPDGYSEDWTEEDMRDASAASLRYINDQMTGSERPNG